MIRKGLSRLHQGLYQPHVWVLMGLVILGRLLWLLYWGVLLEDDSLGYLSPHTMLYHPPGYTVFCVPIYFTTGSLVWVILAQCIAYGIAATLLLMAWVPSSRNRLLLALALGLEPLSGKLACSLMSETIFLATIFCSLAALRWLLDAKGREKWLAAALVGGLLGVAELIRYAAPAFLLGVALWLFLHFRYDLKSWALVAVIILSAQVAKLPLNIFYKIRFDTWSTNAFSGLSRWNSAAYLFPGSATSATPRNEWERFLTGLPDSSFNMIETWHTKQMFHESCGFQRYVMGKSTSEILEASSQAGSTSLSLILDSPLRHLNSFVLPNVIRPFTMTDSIYSEKLWAELPQNHHFHFRNIHAYQPFWWWVSFFALLAGTIMAWTRRAQNIDLVAPLIFCCWLYLGGIGLMTVVFLRFVFLLGPLIVLSVGLQLLPKIREGAEQEVR